MLRDGWNFHNDIAIPLENVARKMHGDYLRPLGKSYDADAIESGTFAECMIQIVREKTGYTTEDNDVNRFIEKCYSYMGVEGSQIDKHIAQSLFNEFNALIDK